MVSALSRRFWYTRLNLSAVEHPLVRNGVVPARSTVLRDSSSMSSFRSSDIEVTVCPEDKRHPKPDSNELIFGAHFSDHMFEVEYRSDRGWGKPRICPLHDLVLHPATKALHYAVQLFEGLKAYRGYDDKIRLFRPEMNIARMLRSAERSALPQFDGAEFLECMKKLITIDRDWVPDSASSTLYIRPTMIGTEPTLGVTQSKSALLYIITGPVGPYYPTGFKPVSLYADPCYVRSCIGGCGSFKMGANYGPTIYVQLDAVRNHNCQQVLWLYGPDHKVTEVGTMNFFMYWINEKGQKELVTPPLSTGLILPGITRLSLMEIARQWGEFDVVERPIFMRDILKALDDNRLLELFGAGTACVVCPIERILYEGKQLEIPTMVNNAPITMRLHKELTDIQYGKTPSSWTIDVD